MTAVIYVFTAPAVITWDPGAWWTAKARSAPPADLAGDTTRTAASLRMTSEAQDAL